ncbi:uncharacterized protein LOC131242436 isoform X2 [Magnolia sinica]|uniref:uncharacterized protein LOC131242436 isoform X1 n=1 Tax=Magnolia sinica TaxID=86752 RepID=UPI002659B21D|nr:uncharacterized protein LOC131242436 isoform X1 [Magnolia sinica]XP_058097040.1 uncharacterized protein LOC131242436 isoform X2 [Magnolia sinica]
MDSSLLLMLSNLIHLQNQLDPTTSLLSEPNTSSPLSSSSSTSAAPLLFFTIASVLSYASSALLHRSTSSSSPPSSPTKDDVTISAFRSLSTDRIWSMDPLARDAQWRSSYGLSYPVFSSLVDHLKPHILRSNLSIPADYAVAMVLARLAHAHPPSRLARSHNLDPFLVSKITNMVTRLLSTKLYPDFIKIPVGHRLLQTIHAFRDLTSLPNMCGAISGSPVRISRLPDRGDVDPSAYLSRHGFPAVLLQAVADHRKIFWDVCVKAPGAADDVSHFRDSLLYQRLTSAEILRDSVVTVRGHHVRPYITGDNRYPLLSFLLTPFSPPDGGGSGAPAQNQFDAALARGRAAVEQAIGLLKGRWRILQDLNVGLNHAPQTIVACCVLHNICQIAGEPEPALFKDPKEMGPPARVLESEKSLHYVGEKLRQAMADDLQERQQRLSSR